MPNSQTFTQKLAQAFNDIGSEKIFSKGDFILREGEIEKNLYLVKTGAIRVFYLSEFRTRQSGLVMKVHLSIPSLPLSKMRHLNFISKR